MNLFIENPVGKELLDRLAPVERFLARHGCSPDMGERLHRGSDLRRFCRNRLTEISGKGGGAGLTLAFSLLREAQERDESVLWISSRRKPFYPLDAYRNGVDLSRLPVLFLKHSRDAFISGAKLLGSGGFGFVVWDLASWRRAEQSLPLAFLGRINAQAHHHRASVLVLTDKKRDDPSLGCLVSLRLQVEALPGHPELLEVEVVRDKRGVTGGRRRWEWRCGLPDGLPAAASVSLAVAASSESGLAGEKSCLAPGA